jgi:hypothetical protein
LTTRNQYRVVNPTDLTDLANQVNTILLQMGTRMDQDEWPVGSLMFSTETATPDSKLGYGTWELFASGTDIITMDVGDTGYNKTVYVYKRIA